MLIKCPECGKDVSDMAPACVHCGYPIRNTRISEQKQDKPKQKKTRKMKLPNGFGRITELKCKNLRKPYRVMISDGKDMFGRPIGKLLKPEAYFETYNEAYKALMQYHENPYNFSDDITVSELHERWSKQYYPRISRSRTISLESAWKYCTPLYRMRAREVRKRDIKYILENGYKTEDGKIRKPTVYVAINIKTILASMFDYALDYEIVNTNPAKDLKNNDDMLRPSDSNPHITFTDDEMKIIESEVGKDKTADMIYIECYTGFRPSELLDLRTSSLSMVDWSFTGGNKTKAGKDRLVPIHEKIRPVVQRHYNSVITQGIEYLFPNGRRRMSYGIYRGAFDEFIKKHNLNPDHRPHDCRKTFITMAKKSGIDEYAIKKMVGHTISDLTERVYTVRDIEWLHSELCKMP